MDKNSFNLFVHKKGFLCERYGKKMYLVAEIKKKKFAKQAE